jgi:hypothetical protein
MISVFFHLNLLQVLTGLVENMKHKVNGSLLSDYSRFKNERKLQR